MKYKYKVEHQSPTGNYNRIDYSSQVRDTLIFSYDKEYYPNDIDLPDPQVDPVIPGAKVPLKKVGITPVSLPIMVRRKEGGEQPILAQVSLYCSLDNADDKGLNFSRLYLVMLDSIRNQFSVSALENILEELADKQQSSTAYCKLRFQYMLTQKALRTRAPLTQEELDNGQYQELESGEKISLRKMEGYLPYDVILEGRYNKNDPDKKYRFYLTINYVYSSTCPCSYALATEARISRGVATNAHSQRSVMTTTVEFDPDNLIWIEDLVDLHREHIPTEVQVIVKRRDEGAFAEMNGANLMFAEDAVRIMYKALDQWYDQGKIFNFTISTNHQESLHPWSAIAVHWKHSDCSP